MALTEGSPLPNITTNQAQQTTAPSWYTDYLSNLANFVTGQTIGTPSTTVDGVTKAAVPGTAQFVGAQPLQQAAFQLAGNLAKSYGIDPATFLQKSATGTSADAGAMGDASISADMMYRGGPETQAQRDFAAQRELSMQGLQNGIDGTGTSTDGLGPISNVGKSIDGGLQPLGIQGALKNIQNLSTADITKAGTQGGQSRIEEFMNPYTRQVVDAIGELGKRNINQYLAPGAVGSAVGSGQFGSKRGAEILGQSINQGLQNIGALQSQALQSGYAQALQAAQAEQDKRLAQNLGYGQLSQLGQGMTLADLNALATMGGQQQTIAQNEQLFPLTAALQGAQAIRGYSVPTGVTSTYTGPIPGAYAASPLSQIAGLGSIMGGISNTPLGSAAGDWLKSIFKTTPGTIFGNSDSGGSGGTDEYEQSGGG